MEIHSKFIYKPVVPKCTRYVRETYAKDYIPNSGAEYKIFKFDTDGEVFVYNDGKWDGCGPVTFFTWKYKEHNGNWYNEYIDEEEAMLELL